MSRRCSPFKQRDVARLIKGVLAAGLVVSGVEIDKARKILVRTCHAEGEHEHAEANGADSNPWDEVLPDSDPGNSRD
jgi:hypothetical protein